MSLHCCNWYLYVLQPRHRRTISEHSCCVLLYEFLASHALLKIWLALEDVYSISHFSSFATVSAAVAFAVKSNASKVSCHLSWTTNAPLIMCPAWLSSSVSHRLSVEDDWYTEDIYSTGSITMYQEAVNSLHTPDSRLMFLQPVTPQLIPVFFGGTDLFEQLQSNNQSCATLTECPIRTSSVSTIITQFNQNEWSAPPVWIVIDNTSKNTPNSAQNFFDHFDVLKCC